MRPESERLASNIQECKKQLSENPDCVRLSCISNFQRKQSRSLPMTGKMYPKENLQNEDDSISSKSDFEKGKKPSESLTTNGEPMTITRRLKKLVRKSDSSNDTTTGSDSTSE